MENSVIPDYPMATVVKILELIPIPNADNIELAKVLGWQVIVKKGEFSVGDLAIYFCIGSVLPVEDVNFAFLQGKPIKTKKIRNTLSQGLLLPLFLTHSYNLKDSNISQSEMSMSQHLNISLCEMSMFQHFREGDDVTQQLNVRKWVSREELSLYSEVPGENDLKAPFPSCIPKTNEERVQNITKKLVELQNKPIVITQKYDGTSATFMIMNGKFAICGRNNVLLKENGESHHYFEIAKRYNLEAKLLELKRNVAIQGEIIGQRKDGRYKINSNRHHLLDFEFHVFNIFDIDKRYYMNWSELTEITNSL